MDSELNFDAAMKALAHPLRREILQWLKDAKGCFPDQTVPVDIGVCAGEIDRRAGLSQSAVSSHLAALQRAGLVTSTRMGQWILFKRNEAAIARLLDMIGQSL